MSPKSPLNILVSNAGETISLATGASSMILRRRQVQVVHRHGDRSPITSLKDEEYWMNELIPEERLTEIGRGVTIVSDDVALKHGANGRGPFGKLTALGLKQMQDLGETLRRECMAGDIHESKVDAVGNRVYPFVARAPTRSNVKIVSTSFARAIQSAQGVIAGLFPDGYDHSKDGSVEIDARHTIRLLPDPQPRETAEQRQLEDALAARPHLQAREDELLPLAVKVTAALHPLLAADAHEAVFGAKQVRQTSSAESIEVEPLAWNQLAEITKCLACRDMLPASITEQDHHDVVQHAAWRWFESFRHPRLAYLGMHEQCLHMVNSCRNYCNDEPPMIVYSAHDSSLIGLHCAFKLERPVSWPEYGSYLMMELLEVSDAATKQTPDLYVRFSLNGELLRTKWDEGEPADMILLEHLAGKLQNEKAKQRKL